MTKKDEKPAYLTAVPSELAEGLVDDQVEVVVVVEVVIG